METPIALCGAWLARNAGDSVHPSTAPGKSDDEELADAVLAEIPGPGSCQRRSGATWPSAPGTAPLTSPSGCCFGRWRKPAPDATQHSRRSTGVGPALQRVPRVRGTPSGSAPPTLESRPSQGVDDAELGHPPLARGPSSASGGSRRFDDDWDGDSEAARPRPYPGKPGRPCDCLDGTTLMRQPRG